MRRWCARSVAGTIALQLVGQIGPRLRETRRRDHATSGAGSAVRTEYDVPEEVEAAHVFSLGKRLQDVAALRVQDAHGLQLRED